MALADKTQIGGNRRAGGHVIQGRRYERAEKQEAGNKHKAEHQQQQEYLQVGQDKYTENIDVEQAKGGHENKFNGKLQDEDPEKPEAVV